MTAALSPLPSGARSVPDRAGPAPHEGELQLLRRQARTRVRRRRTAAGLAAFSALTVLLLFSVVAAHVAITQNQFRLEKLDARAVEEQAEYERLRLRVAELESPGRVVADAQHRLGMVQPAEVTYLSPDPSPTFAAPAKEPRAAGGKTVAAADPATGWQIVKPHLAER